MCINEQHTLSASVRELHHNRGDLIHTGGDCMGLILVTSGQLRAYTVSEDGREITLYRLFERDICLFSASCMMNSIQFDIALCAEKDTDAVIIPSDIYRSIMEKSAPLANYTNEVMASRSLKITHEEIGNHLGNPREVVTRMLKYFVGEGAVKLSRGTVEIINEDILAKIAGR